MAQQTTCDGCGGVILNEVHPRGFAIKRDYCESCACGVNGVDGFLKARDDLHNRLQRAWDEGIVEMRKAFYAEHPNGKLPDGD